MVDATSLNTVRIDHFWNEGRAYGWRPPLVRVVSRRGGPLIRAPGQQCAPGVVPWTVRSRGGLSWYRNNLSSRHLECGLNTSLAGHAACNTDPTDARHLSYKLVVPTQAPLISKTGRFCWCFRSLAVLCLSRFSLFHESRDACMWGLEVQLQSTVDPLLSGRQFSVNVWQHSCNSATAGGDTVQSAQQVLVTRL